MTATEYLYPNCSPMGARPEVNGPSAREICVHADQEEERQFIETGIITSARYRVDEKLD